MSASPNYFVQIGHQIVIATKAAIIVTQISALPFSVFLFLPALASAQGTLTVQVGSPGKPPVHLVAHSDTWLFHKGTNAPAPGWQTNSAIASDSAWGSGAGGFGYADNSNELALVQTPLPDMQNRYSTFYIRRSFEITDTVNPEVPLYLVMDWDDGFVAWLDGVELPARMNAPGSVGTEPSFDSTATAGHESSRGNTSPQPAMTFSLGPVGTRLAQGWHVLAIQGLNAATNSSDFIMIPDLVLGDGSSPGILNGALLSIVRTNWVLLSGTNTIPGSARVLVDGTGAEFDSGTGFWSLSVSLSPGFNRLLLQVMDSTGVQLFATNQDIAAELAWVAIGGTLATNAVLSPAMGVYHVTNSLVVPAGGSLSISPGCVFLMSPGANFAVTNATLTVSGTEPAPIYFAPADGSSAWGGLIVSGTQGGLLAQNIETIAGHLELVDGATATVEDSYFHDYTTSVPAIIHTFGQPNHCALTLRRCHVNRYYEILCQLSTNRFEDCLMENQAPGGDGIDFDAGQPGSILRRCTVRHGRFTNVDALDMGEFGGTGESTRGVLIDSCNLYDFVDKGVSMGVQVDVTVTNCLIHHVDAGIAVKDLSTAGIYGCTIVSNAYGFHCYNKASPSSPTGGGFITNSFNNILWDNGQTLSLLNGSTLTASFSDFQNTNVPGAGNLSIDPVWLNPAEFDFRASPDSLLLRAGASGSAMGAIFPVGARMASSHPQFSSIESGEGGITLRFWADSERSYSLLVGESLSGSNWAKVADVFPGPLPRKVAVSDTNAVSSTRFYRLVTPRLK